MKRREALKTIGLTTITAGFLLKSCKAPVKSELVTSDNLDLVDGREAWEVKYLENLNSYQFFNAHELSTLKVLVDIIIPEDAPHPSASQVGVVEFIEFIVKDIPKNQVPLRGGLKWLDNYSAKKFDKGFIDCSKEEQIRIVDTIAYPSLAPAELGAGVAFFSLLRNLTASGYYTSKEGIEDLGYVGNKPNQWEGVPQNILKQYGLI